MTMIHALEYYIHKKTYHSVAVHVQRSPYIQIYYDPDDNGSWVIVNVVVNT